MVDENKADLKGLAAVTVDTPKLKKYRAAIEETFTVEDVTEGAFGGTVAIIRVKITPDRYRELQKILTKLEYDWHNSN